MTNVHTTMLKIFISLSFYIVFSIISYSQSVPKGYCLVHLEVQRSNESPLKNECITFKTTDKPYGMGKSVVTDDNGKCSILLKKKKRYTIYFLEYTYTRMLSIPNENEYTYPIPILIDEGLFATLKVEFINFEGTANSQEWVRCTDDLTGQVREGITNQDGQAFFYVPRGHAYTFDVKTEYGIRTYEVKMAKGYATYEVRVPLVGLSTEEYKIQEINYREAERKWKMQERYNDSIIGVTPVEVILFFNNETGQEFPQFKVYAARDKKVFYGQINNAWSSEGMCESGHRLCLGSVTGIPDEAKAVIPLELTRGIHTFYIESLDGSVKKEVDVNIPVNTSLNHLEDYKITAPICY